jgi:hypothetical protein
MKCDVHITRQRITHTYRLTLLAILFTQLALFIIPVTNITLRNSNQFCGLVA